MHILGYTIDVNLIIPQISLKFVNTVLALSSDKIYLDVHIPVGTPLETSGYKPAFPLFRKK